MSPDEIINPLSLSAELNTLTLGETIIVEDKDKEYKIMRTK